MKLFSIFVRPYTNAIKNLEKSGKRIKDDIEMVSESLDKEKKKEGIRYVGAKDSKDAFEVLFKENEWTEDELTKKAAVLRKSRFIMMGFAWLSIMAALFFFTFFYSKNWFLMTLFTFFFITSAVMCLLNMLRYALYYEQVIKRDLISLKQFFSEGEYLRKFFG